MELLITILDLFLTYFLLLYLSTTLDPEKSDSCCPNTSFLDQKRLMDFLSNERALHLGLTVPGNSSQMWEGGGREARYRSLACPKCLEFMYQYLHIYTLTVITFSSAQWECFPLQSCPLKASIPVSLLLETIQRSFLTSKDCQVLFKLRTCGLSVWQSSSGLSGQPTWKCQDHFWIFCMIKKDLTVARYSY